MRPCSLNSNYDYRRLCHLISASVVNEPPVRSTCNSHRGTPFHFSDTFNNLHMTASFSTIAEEPKCAKSSIMALHKYLLREHRLLACRKLPSSGSEWWVASQNLALPVSHSPRQSIAIVKASCSSLSEWNSVGSLIDHYIASQFRWGETPR